MKNELSEKLNNSFAAAVLVGGKGSRMGQNKAFLLFGESDFVRTQLAKFRALGITELYSSGLELTAPDVKFLPDVYPERGPLGGIHAALRAATRENVLVLSVDTPLVPTALLQELCLSHLGSGCEATLVQSSGRSQPLIAVYSKVLAERCERILQGGSAPVMRLVDEAEVSFFDFAGDERLLANCNTPLDYERLKGSI